jgi:hypothetical protein
MLSALLLTLLLQDSKKPDLLLDGLQVNTGPFVYSGARPHVAVFASGELEMDAEPFTDGEFTLNYETKTLRAFGLGFTANHGLLRTSLSFVYGEWEGEGSVHVPTAGVASGPSDDTGDGGVEPEPFVSPSEKIDLTGKLYGAELDIYWPAIVLCLGSVELSVGPQVGGHFYIQHVDDFDDIIPEFAWSIGPRASLRIAGSKVGFSVDAGLNYLFGDLVGPIGQISASLSF